ncbi:MAG: DUF835 domain-containing protein [Euryarchaeota archaeon]|nr:DUF835 domain-containing protein [Euryarchaeota archaeon]MDE1879325.1 DUF835 domain-containing protein [Euryarchaeota archaeon]
MVARSSSMTSSIELPIVGRSTEQEQLSDALEHARTGAGGAWVVSATVGMGKTQLMRWLESTARRGGFETSWGYGVREAASPFFAFEQLLRPREGNAAAAVVRRLGEREPPPLLLVRGAAEERFWKELADSVKGRHPLLLARAGSLPDRAFALPLQDGGTKVLLSRAASDAHLAPELLDIVADRVLSHLRDRRGEAVVLAALDYLVSYNGFVPVLKFVQAVRDEALRNGGSIILVLNPKTLEPRQMSLLQAEGEVVPLTGEEERGPDRSAPPSERMLAYLDELERRQRASPQLLLLDDLQWTDEPSLRTFHFLARNAISLRVLIVASLRTEGRGEGVQPGTVLAEVLAKMQEDRLARRIDLQGLTEPEVERLVGSVSGSPVAREASEEGLRALRERTGGNPYFLTEAVRAGLASGRFPRVDGKIQVPSPEAAAHEIPESLRRMLTRQLEGLSDPDRALVEVAALVGSRFELPPLASVLGMERETLTQELQRLGSSSRLFAFEEEEDRWRFTHPLLWECAVASTPDGRRKALSRTLAEWWATHRPDRVDEVARLWYEAREPSEGLPWARRAIDQAIRAHHAEGAERFHGWLQELLALRGDSSQPRVEEGLRAISAMLADQGSTPQALRMAQSLERLGADPPASWYLESAMITLLRPFDPPAARERLEKFEEEIARNGDKVPLKVWTSAVNQRVTALQRSGNYARALELSQESLRRIADARMEEELAGARLMALYNSGWALKELGRIEDARKVLEDVWSVSRRLGSPRLETYCLVLEGALAEISGDLAACQSAFERTLVIDRQIGHVSGAVLDALNLASTCARRGEFGAAEVALSEARRLAQRFGLPQGDVGVPRVEGDLRLRQGRPAQAHEVLVRARDGYRRIGHREMEAACDLAMAEASLSLGLTARSEEELQRVAAVQKVLQRMIVPTLLRVRGELALATGAPGVGWSRLEEAYVMARGDGNLVEAANVRAVQADWEEREGRVEDASAHRSEAWQMYERCGVLAAARLPYDRGEGSPRPSSSSSGPTASRGTS